MARRKTVLEKHELGGEGPPPPTIRESNVPSTQNVKVNEGGKGGTVILIAGTLFIGYLYFTRRLQNVFKAVQAPGTTGILSSSGTNNPSVQPQNPTTGGYSTIPINPSGYPKRFTLTFGPRYPNARPVEISAGDPASCWALVYSATFEATGSPIMAAIYARTYC